MEEEDVSRHVEEEEQPEEMDSEIMRLKRALDEQAGYPAIDEGIEEEEKVIQSANFLNQMLCEEEEGEVKPVNVVGGGWKSDLYRCDTRDRSDGSHTSSQRRSGVHGGGGSKATGNGNAEEHSTLHLSAFRSC